jgi:hypothetical protein
MVTSRTLAKHRGIPSRRLTAFIPQKSISIVKKLKERALSLRGKLPAPYNSREFFVEIWERESAPAELLDVTAIDGGFFSELADKIIGD